jgi:hypothetical protein
MGFYQLISPLHTEDLPPEHRARVLSLTVQPSSLVDRSCPSRCSLWSVRDVAVPCNFGRAGGGHQPSQNAHRSPCMQMASCCHLVRGSDCQLWPFSVVLAPLLGTRPGEILRASVCRRKCSARAKALPQRWHRWLRSRFSILDRGWLPLYNS